MPDKVDVLRDQHNRDMLRLEGAIKSLAKDVKQALNHLSSRLPWWGVAVLAGQSVVIGWLLRVVYQ
jgi:ElaB/YqjD/DUF883 family membrane-anchored ribosome-binding protein